jgi:ferredoxin-type protein NapH
MDCFSICPEPQVIKPALKGAAVGRGPIIDSIDCTKCGRCVEVCDREVFGLALGRERSGSCAQTASEPHLL